MVNYVSAVSRHPTPAHAVGEVAGHLLEQLDQGEPDLVVVFVSPPFVNHLDDMLFAFSNLIVPRHLIGLSAGGLISDTQEIESGPGLAVWAAYLPEAHLQPFALEFDEGKGKILGWPDEVDNSSHVVLFADPFSFPTDGFLGQLNQSHPGLKVSGGLASCALRPGGNALALDSKITTQGAVGVVIEGVDIKTVVSQGCRPIGDPMVVTKSERNVVEQIAGQSPMDRLRKLSQEVSEADRALLANGLHLGVVVNEHQSDFDRGDFLIRNILGADRNTGSIAVGDQIAVGQTVQFHVRDAAAAAQDLHLLLSGHQCGGALVFDCNGRGKSLFGVPNHDATLIAEDLDYPATAGAFCAGEIGPIGSKNFLHGFTASIALFPK